MNKPEKLAIFGGNKVVNIKFKKYNYIGKEERDAAIDVINSGVLSKFLGTWSPDFYGGDKVQLFEKHCEEFFNVKNAIVVNSWTSGLIAAVGAIGIEPGDEVILSPWTMSASATAILHWSAIPVFADIEPDTFNIDPVSVERNITPYTKAILAIDIFGHPADMDALQKIANKYDLKIISDTAQAPGAKYKNQFAGTIADIGGFSLNYHKHIHTGEGGVIVTNNDDYANKLRLIRNHAESVVGAKGEKDLVNMVGYNFRLGEIECAIGIEQLKKLPRLIKNRQHIANRLTRGLSSLKGLRTPIVKRKCSHVYYVYPIVLDLDILNCKKERIVEALVAEGIQGLSSAYQNIHLLPIFQKKVAFGSKGFPWSSEVCKRDVDYTKGICPTAEKLQDKTYIGLDICHYDLDHSEVDLIIEVFNKVWSNIDSLRHKR